MRIARIEKTVSGDVRGVWFEILAGAAAGLWSVGFESASDEWWQRQGAATDDDAPAWVVTRWSDGSPAPPTRVWRLPAHAHVSPDELRDALRVHVGEGVAIEVVRRLRRHTVACEPVRILV